VRELGHGPAPGAVIGPNRRRPPADVRGTQSEPDSDGLPAAGHHPSRV